MQFQVKTDNHFLMGDNPLKMSKLHADPPMLPPKGDCTVVRLMEGLNQHFAPLQRTQLPRVDRLRKREREGCNEIHIFGVGVFLHTAGD